jgi:hypothetical protein
MSTPETAAVPPPVSAPPARQGESYTAAALRRDIPESAEDRHKMAQILCQSPLLPEAMRNPAGVHLYYAAAIAMRVPFFTAIKMMHIVGNPGTGYKMTWESSWIRGRMIGAGHKVRILDATDKGATIRIVRHDDPEPYVISFTEEDAVRAGLIKKNPDPKSSWSKFTPDMYVARVTTKAARWACPEIFDGVMYSPADFDQVGSEAEHYYTPATGETAPVPEVPDEVTGGHPVTGEHHITGDAMKDEAEEAGRQRWREAIEGADTESLERIRDTATQKAILDNELYPDGTTVRRALDARLAELAHCAADDVIEVGVLNGDEDDEDDPGFPGDAPQPETGPEPDPEAACRMNAARKGILKGLEDRAPGGDVKGLVLAEYGLPVENVSTSRLLALATHAAGKR